MTNKIIYDVMFEMNDDDEKSFKNNLNKYDEMINKIKNFNFSKYENYLNEFDDERTSFSNLRDDEPIIYSQNKISKLFKNSIKFEDGYVVLKNEK